MLHVSVNECDICSQVSFRNQVDSLVLCQNINKGYFFVFNVKIHTVVYVKCPCAVWAMLGSYLFMIQLKLEEEHDIGTDKIPHWERLNV